MKKPVMLILTVLVGAWCLMYVGIKIDMWRLGYQLEELESQRMVLKRQQESLLVQITKLTDPQQIAQRAGQQLGFMSPQEGQIVMISLDTLPPLDLREDSPVRLVQTFPETPSGGR